MQRQSSYKVHMNTITNGELSDPLCDSVMRGLTLVRLTWHKDDSSLFKWMPMEIIANIEDIKKSSPEPLCLSC